MSTEQALKDEIAGRREMDAKDMQAEKQPMPPSFSDWYYSGPDEDGNWSDDEAEEA